MSDVIFDIANKITQKMGSLIGVKVYITISDKEGNFIYSDDEAFNQHKDFIKNFVVTNFSYLSEGEHSIPLSSENIIFFKTSENTITVLYNPKGKIGQLLVFKSFMGSYHDSLDSFVIEGEITPERIIEKVPITLDTTQKGIETLVISLKKNYYKKIRPIITRKLKKKEKFNLIQSMILNKCDGKYSLLNIIESVNAKESAIINFLYELHTRKLINFEKHEFLKIQCPECKSSAIFFLPRFLLKRHEKRLRVQLFPEGCDHTFLAFIDKKFKIKTKTIERLQEPSDFLDLTNLSVKDLISFLGQDIFFNIFHGIFFRFYTVFIGNEEISREITAFLKRIFTQLEYGRHIFTIDRTEYENNPEKYTDYLIIDLDSKITIDPYEEEEFFDFELKLFKKILKSEDYTAQILATYTEFERLILLTDTILKELETIEQISEDDLIKNMDEKYQMEINRYEIPIIKKLSEIYYDTDINKKVTRTVVGQMSSWFEKI